MLASGLNLLGVDPFFAIGMWVAILLQVMTFEAFSATASLAQNRSEEMAFDRILYRSKLR
jgi:hypothetical protein